MQVPLLTGQGWIAGGRSLSFAVQQHCSTLCTAVPACCLQAPAGVPPDVWLQLLEQCAANREAQPAVISCMLRQLQQQRQQAAAVRAEAAAEAAELRRQVQASEGRAQQQEQRLQDVEGQLREVLAALRL
jgi:hypothetical protein